MWNPTSLTLAFFFAHTCACGGGNNGNQDAAVVADASVECTVVDQNCPDIRPYAGGLCEGELTCSYPEESMTTWTFTCSEQGEWIGDCESNAPDGCSGIPLSKTCENPFDGNREDTAVEIGPVSITEPFRTFTNDEMIDVVWGGQGLPMLAYRIRLVGGDDLGCISVNTTLEIGGNVIQSGAIPSTLRCGQTPTVYTILDGDICDDRIYDLEVEVVIDGIGTATSSLTFQGDCLG